MSDDLDTLRLKQDVQSEQDVSVTTPVDVLQKNLTITAEGISNFLSQTFQQKTDVKTSIVELNKKLDKTTIVKADEETIFKLLTKIDRGLQDMEKDVDTLVRKAGKASIEPGSRNETVVESMLGRLHGMVEQVEQMEKRIKGDLSGDSGSGGSGSSGGSPSRGSEWWQWLQAFFMKITRWCARTISKLVSMAKKVIPLVKMTASTAVYLIYLINFFNGLTP